MITYVDGDLLLSPAQTLVNTVNLVGVMGKGIALRFKQIYPEMFLAYQQACRDGRIAVGRPWLYKTPRKWILNFPTKRHWRMRSKIEDIQAGLRTFVRTYHLQGIRSVAFPALGCGNGELDWAEVRPLMERWLAPLPIPVFIYPPLKTAEIPEHRRPEEIRQWLRSEPATLPFAEVWDDLVHVAQEYGGSMGQVQVESVEDELFGPMNKLVFRMPEGVLEFTEQELADFWDVFRDQGLMSWSDIEVWFGYRARVALALFRRLPYVDDSIRIQKKNDKNWRGAIQLVVPPAQGENTSAIDLTRANG